MATLHYIKVGWNNWSEAEKRGKDKKGEMSEHNLKEEGEKKRERVERK